MGRLRPCPLVLVHAGFPWRQSQSRPLHTKSVFLFRNLGKTHSLTVSKADNDEIPQNVYPLPLPHGKITNFRVKSVRIKWAVWQRRWLLNDLWLKLTIKTSQWPVIKTHKQTNKRHLPGKSSSIRPVPTCMTHQRKVTTPFWNLVSMWNAIFPGKSF